MDGQEGHEEVLSVINFQEMKMETTRSYRNTSTKMSKIEKTKDTKCCWKCGRTKSHEASCVEQTDEKA